VLEKAMDPFFTTKEVGKGTGLGLSLVYSTVKAHQGQLDIQSEPGSGTQVRLRFPTCAAPKAGASPLAPAPAANGALHVVVVDDDELIRCTLPPVLERLGHRVTAFASGELALASLEAGLRPDFVILDMNMPGLGGAGTLPRLRALRPALPVLLATGRLEPAVLELAAAHPQVRLLAKPFSIKEIREQLEGIRPVDLW
jgi:CheY-like chemotaxis protein